LIRQHGKLLTSQIREELQPPLELKGEPEASARLEQKIAVIDRRMRGSQP
jgi:hypothetical protein